MKNKIIKTVSLISLIMCLILAFAGCFAGDEYGEYSMSVSESAFSNEGEEKVVDISNGRKTFVEKNLDFQVSPGEVKNTVDAMKQDISDFNGVVLYEHTNNGSYNDDYDSATLTVKIPSDKVEDFISKISADRKISYQSENLYDVTNQYSKAKERLEQVKKEIAVYTGFYDPETGECEAGAIITVADKIAVMEKLEPLLKEKAELEKQVAPYEVSSSSTKITLYVFESDYSGYVVMGVGGLFVLGILVCVIIVVVHSVKKRNKNKAVKF